MPIPLKQHVDSLVSCAQASPPNRLSDSHPPSYNEPNRTATVCSCGRRHLSVGYAECPSLYSLAFTSDDDSQSLRRILLGHWVLVFVSIFIFYSEPYHIIRRGWLCYKSLNPLSQFTFPFLLSLSCPSPCTIPVPSASPSAAPASKPSSIQTPHARQNKQVLRR